MAGIASVAYSPAVQSIIMSLLKELLSNMGKKKNDSQKKEVDELKNKIEEMIKDKEENLAKLVEEKNSELKVTSQMNEHLACEVFSLRQKLAEQERAGSLSMDLLRERESMQAQISELENRMETLRTVKETKESEVDQKQSNNKELIDLVRIFSKLCQDNTGGSSSSTSSSASVQEKEKEKDVLSKIASLLEDADANPEKSKKSKKKTNKNAENTKEDSVSSPQSSATQVTGPVQNMPGPSNVSGAFNMPNQPGQQPYYPQMPGSSNMGNYNNMTLPNMGMYPNVVGPPPNMQGPYMPNNYNPHVVGPPYQMGISPQPQHQNFNMPPVEFLPHMPTQPFGSNVPPVNYANNWNQQQGGPQYQPNVFNKPNNFNPNINKNKNKNNNNKNDKISDAKPAEKKTNEKEETNEKKKNEKEGAANEKKKNEKEGTSEKKKNEKEGTSEKGTNEKGTNEKGTNENNKGNKKNEKSGISSDLWGQLDKLKENIKENKLSKNELMSQIPLLMTEATKSTIPSQDKFMVELSECLDLITKLPETSGESTSSYQTRRNFKTDFKKHYNKGENWRDTGRGGQNYRGNQRRRVSQEAGFSGKANNEENNQNSDENNCSDDASSLCSEPSQYRGRGGRRGNFNKKNNSKFQQQRPGQDNDSHDNAQEKNDSDDATSVCSERSYNYRGRGKGQWRGGRGNFRGNFQKRKSDGPTNERDNVSEATDKIKPLMSHTIEKNSSTTSFVPPLMEPSTHSQSPPQQAPSQNFRKPRRNPPAGNKSNPTNVPVDDLINFESPDDPPPEAAVAYASKKIMKSFIGNDIPSLMDAIFNKIDVQLKVKNCILVATKNGEIVNEIPRSLLDIIQFKQSNPDAVCIYK